MMNKYYAECEHLICNHQLPTRAQVYDYYNRVGFDNMESKYQELYNIYVKVDAHDNQVEVRGDDFVGIALGFIVGCVVGYMFYKLGGK